MLVFEIIENLRCHFEYYFKSTASVLRFVKRSIRSSKNDCQKLLFKLKKIQVKLIVMNVKLGTLNKSTYAREIGLTGYYVQYFQQTFIFLWKVFKWSTCIQGKSINCHSNYYSKVDTFSWLQVALLTYSFRESKTITK